MVSEAEVSKQLQLGATALADLAPHPTALAERIIREAVGARPRRREAPFRGWLIPVGAGLAAAAVIAASVLEIDRVRQHKDQLAPSAAPQIMDSTGVPAGFTASAVSFITPQDGWVLGSLPCSAQRCAAVIHTVDGAATWTLSTATALASPAGSTGIRFATDRIGYVYGSGGMFMTRDAGASWTKVAYRADDLVISNGHVLWSLNSLGLGADAFCVQALCGRSVLYTAPVGSASWIENDYTPALAPGRDIAVANASAQLASLGSIVAVQLRNVVAGSHAALPSQLLVSTDSGTHWQRRPSPPCAQGFSIALATPSKVVIGCEASGPVQLPQPVQLLQVFSSNDLGAHFTQLSDDKSAPIAVLAATSQKVLLSRRGRLYLVGMTPPASLSEPIEAGPKSAIGAQALGSNALIVLEPAGAGSRLWFSTDAGGSWSVRAIK